MSQFDSEAAPVAPRQGEPARGTLLVFAEGRPRRVERGPALLGERRQPLGCRGGGVGHVVYARFQDDQHHAGPTGASCSPSVDRSATSTGRTAICSGNGGAAYERTTPSSAWARRRPSGRLGRPTLGVRHPESGEQVLILGNHDLDREPLGTLTWRSKGRLQPSRPRLGPGQRAAGGTPRSVLSRSRTK